MSNSTHALRDTRLLREPLETGLIGAMPAFFVWIGIILAADAVADLASLPSSARVIVVYDVVASLLCFGARYAWGKLPSLRRFVHPVGLTFCLALASNTVATMVVTGEISYGSHLAVMVVGAGAFFASVGWMIAFDVFVAVAWLVTAWHLATPSQLWAQGIALALSAALAAMFLATRMQAHGRIALLRARDRVRGERLRRALANARGEIGQRERVEIEEKRLREQLLQASKMDAVGRLAGGVAHEINNALASIAMVSGLMLEEEGLGPVARDDLQSIQDAAGRAGELTRKLSAVGRGGKYSTESLDPGDLVDRARQSLADRLAPPIDVEVELDHDNAKAQGDASQLVQAIRDLLVNAADAMPDGGLLSIRTRRVTLAGREAHARAVAPGDYVAIIVTDSGPGMDSETRKAAFDPFFTTKPFGGGVGLGLSTVYGAARTHGGSAEIESIRGRGTTVTLHVPCADEERAERNSSVPPSGPRTDIRGCSVLLVDDEAAIRGAGRRILERMGLRVREAENGRRALEAYAVDGPFDLVVADMVMPMMGGKELFLRLREKVPNVRVLLVSGFAPDDSARFLLEAGALGFLEKPFTAAGLTRAVRAALTTVARADSATEA
jgi:signal transduction histidine kinase/ActR/RegA family two-component response regulator